MNLTTHWRISLPPLTFAIRAGYTPADWLIVTEAAPIAGWCVGRPLAWVLGYYRRKGAQIDALEG